MNPTALMSAETLMANLGNCLVIDVRFQLTDPEWGAREYAKAHIPGAYYWHLDHDLSGAKQGHNGRHPLPDAALFIGKLQSLGLAAAQQVVLVDQGNGMMAARGWWMIKHWLGHLPTAVLEGGYAAWQALGYPCDNLIPQPNRPAHPAPLRVHPEKVVQAEALMPQAQNPEQKTYSIIDARTPERFQGIGETLDPVGGHIPSALNQFCGLNVQADGRWHPPEMLREIWQATLTQAKHPIVHQCGSGVTACHNWLALEVAGLATPDMKLYAGSWSEWCADPKRPIAT